MQLTPFAGSQGKLLYFYKDPYCKVPIFMSGTAERCVLWIGGQSESFFTIGYFEQLATELEGSWSFVQMEIPSSHIGYGAQDHLCEAEDVDDVIEMLLQHHGIKEVTLFATSTGVQIALQLLAHGRNVAAITRVVLHGIVCPVDNEFFCEKGVKRRNDRVQELLKDGRKEDSRAMIGYYDIPITAGRLAQESFPSLQEALWIPALSDDADVCIKAFKSIKVPTLILIATDSQYKPSEDELSKVIKMAKTSLSCPEDDTTIKVLNDTCDELRRLLRADIPNHVKTITEFLTNADERRANAEANEAARQAEIAREKRIRLSKMSVA